ncbi:MAG: class I SAM-dependent methyltransferase [Candidatus Hodarchaeota archaeon]
MPRMRVQKSTINYYNTLSRWGDKPDEANRQRVKQIAARVPTDVRTVLDLGCGDGTVSNQLVEKKLDVTGVDVSSKALQYFKGKGSLADLNHLPFKDRSFDLVICSEVLEHLTEGIYERAIEEIERVAKLYIIITTPNEEYLPAGFVRCTHCRCTFHMNLHVRMLNRRTHSALFEEFELIETIGINHWSHNPLAVWIEQNLLGVYKFKKGLACPYCGSSNIEKPGLLRDVFAKGVRLLSRIVPRHHKARWIASFYQYKGL